MGWSDNEQNSSSKFNEAWKKLTRLDKEQDKVNEANSNLLAFNLEINEYNFHLKFNSLNTLLAEISGELTKTRTDKKLRKVIVGELEQGKAMRTKIKEFIKVNPIYITRTNLVTHQPQREFKEDSWEELEEMLFEYEIMIKVFMKKHNIGLPEDDDPSKAAYR